MELNREQIIKALECCVSADTFDACRSGCPLFEKGDDCECIFEPTALHKYALSLIKELTEENERLREKADRNLYNLKAVLEEREDSK